MEVAELCCATDVALQRLLPLPVGPPGTAPSSRSRAQHSTRKAGVVELFLGLNQQVIEHIEYACRGPQESHSKLLREHCGEPPQQCAEGKAIGFSLKRIEIARRSALATLLP